MASVGNEAASPVFCLVPPHWASTALFYVSFVDNMFHYLYMPGMVLSGYHLYFIAQNTEALAASASGLVVSLAGLSELLV